MVLLSGVVCLLNITSMHRLKDEIDDLTKERDRYQKKLEKNSIFQKYMERVQESTDEFGEIREIISRYDTLVATNIVSRYIKKVKVIHKPKTWIVKKRERNDWAFF